MITASEASRALRAAGVTVIEHDRWEQRSKPGEWVPDGTVVHHTAGPGPDAGPAPSLAYCYDNLLCQVLVGRDGTWHLLAWGLTWHAGLGVAAALARYDAGLAPLGDAAVAYRGETSTTGGLNSRTVGIEVENDGRGEPWTAAQRAAVVNGVAALHRAGGWSTARLLAHREWTERKVDPAGIDMPSLRAEVAATIGEDMPLTAADLDAIRKLVRQEIDAAADASIKAMFDRRFKTLTKRCFQRAVLTDEIDK